MLSEGSTDKIVRHDGGDKPLQRTVSTRDAMPVEFLLLRCRRQERGRYAPAGVECPRGSV